MSEDVVEMLHHQRVRFMRLDLAVLPQGRARFKLLTMIARAEIVAEAHGWTGAAH